MLWLKSLLAVIVCIGYGCSGVVKQMEAVFTVSPRTCAGRRGDRMRPVDSNSRFTAEGGHLRAFVMDRDSGKVVGFKSFPEQQTGEALVQFSMWFAMLPKGSLIVFSFDMDCPAVATVIEGKLQLLVRATAADGAIPNATIPFGDEGTYNVMCKGPCPTGLRENDSSPDKTLFRLKYEITVLQSSSISLLWLYILAPALFVFACVAGMLLFGCRSRRRSHNWIEASLSSFLTTSKSVDTLNQVKGQANFAVGEGRIPVLSESLPIYESPSSCSTVSTAGTTSQDHVAQSSSESRQFDRIELSESTCFVPGPAALQSPSENYTHPKFMSLSSLYQPLNFRPRKQDFRVRSSLRPSTTLPDLHVRNAQETLSVADNSAAVVTSGSLATGAACISGRTSPCSSHLKFLTNSRISSEILKRDSKGGSTDALPAEGQFAAYMVPCTYGGPLYKVPSSVPKFGPPACPGPALPQTHDLNDCTDVDAVNYSIPLALELESGGVSEPHYNYLKGSLECKHALLDAMPESPC